MPKRPALIGGFHAAALICAAACVAASASAIFLINGPKRAHPGRS